jgi:hypothetical protein
MNMNLSERNDRNNFLRLVLYALHYAQVGQSESLPSPK